MPESKGERVKRGGGGDEGENREALSLRRKPTQRQRNGGRERKKRRRLNEGLVCIHLALISQTERVTVREETEGLLFFATFVSTV